MNPKLKLKMETRTLVECAVMIAVGTILSMIKIDLLWGGGMTVCSMLPLVFIAHRHGTKTGLIAAFAYSLLQLVLGLDNVRYATNFWMAVGIVGLDYVVAYTVIGLSAIFDGKFKNKQTAMVAGIVFSFTLRLACHFITGVWIWEVIWPNDRGWLPPVWSIAYNAMYMVPEMILTSVAACLLYKPLNSLLVRIDK